MASLEELLDALETPRASLTEYESELRADIADDIRSAVSAYRDHVVAIIESNPRRSAEEILSRQDLQRTLTSVLRDLQRTSASRLTEAWNHGQDLAVEHVNNELDAIDAGFRERVTRRDSSYLDDLLRDAQVNIDRLANELIAKVDEVYVSVPKPLSVPEGGTATNVPLQHAQNRADALRRELMQTSGRIANRVQAGGVVASSRGFTERQMQAYERLAARDPSVRKVWVANFVANEPCDMCRALHGTELLMGQSFNPHASFGRAPTRIYRDLMGPPRHPNCRCRLVILRHGVEQDTASVQGMLDFARGAFR